MDSPLLTSRTFENAPEMILFLAQHLNAILRTAMQYSDFRELQMHCLDSTGHRHCDAGGDVERVSEEAITFLKQTANHHAGVFITAGDYHLTIKVNPDCCRLAVKPIEFIAVIVPVE